MSCQNFIEAAYYRGGTSRAIIVERCNLPPEEVTWPLIFLKLIGSPDQYGRQLDGMGAGISSLSKMCVVAPSSHPDADVDYTFYAVGIRDEEVDVSGNCGNISAAIGPYAFDHGMLEKKRKPTADDDIVVVHILNTNTNKMIRSTFVTANGEAQVSGDYFIDGVSERSSRIQLEFLDPAGAKTGKTLSTGNIVDSIDGIEVSCVDVGNPCVFVKAQNFDLKHPASPEMIMKTPDLLDRLERFRNSAAVQMGLIQPGEHTPRAVPKLGLVSPSMRYTMLSGQTQESNAIDVIVHFISDRQPHRAIPLTAAICSGAAAQLKGPIVERHLAVNLVQPDVITIGHPSGMIPVRAQLQGDSEVRSVTVFRTARRLMEGKFFYRAE